MGALGDALQKVEDLQKRIAVLEGHRAQLERICWRRDIELEQYGYYGDEENEASEEAL